MVNYTSDGTIAQAMFMTSAVPNKQKRFIRQDILSPFRIQKYYSLIFQYDNLKTRVALLRLFMSVPNVDILSYKTSEFDNDNAGCYTTDIDLQVNRITDNRKTPSQMRIRLEQ